MEQKDGGPAFPHDDRAQYCEREGMSLRDYFAAKAMQAYLSSSAAPRQYSQDVYARTAYEMADAMLKARAL